MREETLSKIRPASQGAVAKGKPGGSIELRKLLAGNEESAPELPPLGELASALLALAGGRRRKAILPLADTAAEFALVRRGESVQVFCYNTEALPEVLIRDREISLRELLDACARAAAASVREDANNAAAMVKISQRAAQARICADPNRAQSPIEISGGALRDPGENVPLAFGFEAAVEPAADAYHAARWFADVHALLFEGELWAYARGKRLLLFSGPIMLAALRMVAAARELVEGWKSDRPLNVRLRKIFDRRANGIKRRGFRDFGRRSPERVHVAGARCAQRRAADFTARFGSDSRAGARGPQPVAQFAGDGAARRGASVAPRRSAAQPHRQF